MARLFGTDIPNEKRIEASLPYIFGIGPSTSLKILDHAGVSPDIRTGELSEEQLVKIATVIQNEGILIEGDLRREQQGQMKRLSSINLLPWHPPQARASCPWPAHPHQRPHPQG